MTCKFLTLGAALAAVCTVRMFAQERFDSADAAAKALIAAVEQHDTTRISTIFGPQAKDIMTSGNTTQDRAEQDEFARLAKAKYRLEISPMNRNRVVLAIGDEDWPFPVPLLHADGKWSFNAAETPVEMRARRIGADELDAIEICHGYVEAQLKYAAEDRDKDGLLEYAPRLMSTPGKHDGLYWSGENNALVPEGFAQAAWDGGHKGQAKPYHGYYFRILDAQGASAPEGAHNYMVKDKLMGGFGLVAWPADYGVSGIHTFIVNQDDVVYEKDIAPAAGKTAMPVTRFDPDSSWERVQ